MTMKQNMEAMNITKSRAPAGLKQTCWLCRQVKIARGEYSRFQVAGRCKGFFGGGFDIYNFGIF